MISYYLLILIFVLTEGYYSGMETGAYCLNKIRLRFKAEQKSRSALILQKLLADPQGLICTTLIGTNISVYMATALFTSRFERLGVRAPELFSTICLAPVLMIVAEMTPKNIFQIRADSLMYKLAPSLLFCRKLFSPGVWVLKRITGAFSAPPALREKGAPFTAGRLSYFIEQSAHEGVLSPYQRAMATNVMQLGQTPTRKVMIPLKDAVLVSKSATPEEIRELIAQRRFSRIPVYDESRERIVGIINTLDFFCADGGRKPEDLMRPIITLPQDMPIDDALFILQRASYPMGIVVDDKGDAVGIVSIKDLVEEIVGELEVW